MTYYPNSSQLHDDTLLTGLMFVTGSIISGVILYFLKQENDCSLPETTELASTSQESTIISEVNEGTEIEELPFEEPMSLQD